jgi:hypothetical protein
LDCQIGFSARADYCQSLTVTLNAQLNDIQFEIDFWVPHLPIEPAGERTHPDCPMSFTNYGVQNGRFSM